MPASKILANNARYMARTEKSNAAERDFYRTKMEEREHEKLRALQFEESMTEKSNEYAEYWIYEKGDRAKLIIKEHFSEKNSKDPCFINVYDKKERKMEKMKFSDITSMVFENKTELPGNRFGQTRIWGDLYISTEIYKFMIAHWKDLEDESSEC